jgi:hypothetical protein
MSTGKVVDPKIANMSLSNPFSSAEEMLANDNNESTGNRTEGTTNNQENRNEDNRGTNINREGERGIEVGGSTKSKSQKKASKKKASSK